MPLDSAEQSGQTWIVEGPGCRAANRDADSPILRASRNHYAAALFCEDGIRADGAILEKPVATESTRGLAQHR